MTSKSNQPDLDLCEYCGRFFNKEMITRHVQTCGQMRARPIQTKRGISTGPVIPHKKTGTTTKRVTAASHVNTATNPKPVLTNPIQQQCPHCKRSFSHKIFDCHIDRCRLRAFASDFSESNDGES